MIITELRKQKGKSKFFSVFADGVFVCSLDEYSIYKHQLKEDMEIEKQALEEIQSECMESVAFSQAVELLSKTMKTEKQLKEYLQGKGYLNKIVNNVVEKLKNYGYVNDEYYAECLVKQKQHSCGKFKLKQQLKQKGISEEIINKQLEQIEPQEEVLFGLAQKFLRNKELNPNTFSRLSRHLASKGFGWEEINEIIYKIKSKENVDEDWE